MRWRSSERPSGGGSLGKVMWLAFFETERVVEENRPKSMMCFEERRKMGGGNAGRGVACPGSLW